MILRDIQRETNGFTEIALLTFFGPENNWGQKSIGVSVMDGLKINAISRVIFGQDMFNIKLQCVKFGIRRF